MPTYTYVCPVCGTKGDFIRTVEDREDFPWCGNPGCDVEMKRKWGVSAVVIR